MGCGKSTISKRVADALKAKHIAMDRIIDDHGLNAEKEEGYISQASFIKANELAVPEAEEAITNGQPVVFDGNFYWRSQVDDLLSRLHYPHAVFTLQAPLEVCIERDSKRPNPHGPDAAEAVYRKSTEFTVGSVIDVTQSVDDSVHEILTHLPSTSTSPSN